MQVFTRMWLLLRRGVKVKQTAIFLENPFTIFGDIRGEYFNHTFRYGVIQIANGHKCYRSSFAVDKTPGKRILITAKFFVFAYDRGSQRQRFAGFFVTGYHHFFVAMPHLLIG